MLAPILAVRSTWIGILLLLVGLAVLWLIIRGVIDFAIWFNEEIIEDFRDRRRRKKGS